MYKHILISTDGSEVAQKGVDHGISLARSLGANVTIITVTEPFPYYASSDGSGWVVGEEEMSAYAAGQQQYADGVLGRAREAAELQGVTAQVLYVPDARPAEAILKAAKSGDYGLIVMASHGRRGLNRLLLGSQTSEVLASSPVPVLVVR